MASRRLFQESPPFPNDVPTADLFVVPLSGLSANKPDVVKALFEACKSSGFFLLDLQGDELGDVVVDEIDRLWSLMRQLMNLPQETKARYRHDAPKSFLGFKPRGEAKTETRQPDRFEWFNVGQDGLLGNAPLQPLPDFVLEHRELMTSFLRHGQAIMSSILESLAEQLALPPSTFTAMQLPTQPSGTVLRFIKAEASPNLSDMRTSMVHHTDFGTVTLLANVVGGLQVLLPEKDPRDQDSWLYVQPRPGCLIVNLGDAMAQWTDGVLRSSCHRINFSPGDQRFVERYSMGVLARPERNASMKKVIRRHQISPDFEPQQEDVGNEEEEEEEEEEITAWEWEVRKATALIRGDNFVQTKSGKTLAANM